MIAGSNNFSATPEKPVVMMLDHLCCYEVSGADAQSFLQGQLTNDIEAASPARGQLSSYCTPKGRMLAIMQICPVGHKYLLVLRKDIAEAVTKRLQMYVLRAKVTIEQCAGGNSIVGVAGPDAGSVLNALKLAIPHNDYDITSSENSICMKIPGIMPRYQIISNEAPHFATAQLEKSHADSATYKYWQWLDIMSGIPSVNATTQESFVPQMANMELIDGVSFSKGCYPGQEIVARLHYLGNASRRMYRIEAVSETGINPGDEIYQVESDSEQAIGNVVSAVRVESGKIAALAVLRIEAALHNQLAIGSPDGSHAVIMPLPYEIPTEQKQ